MLGSSPNNDNDSHDDEDDSKQIDVVLVQPGGGAKVFTRKCYPKKLGKGVIREVKNSYRNMIAEEQQVAVVVRFGGKPYVDYIRQESQYIQSIESRDATAKELISAIAQQWRSFGWRNDNKDYDTTNR